MSDTYCEVGDLLLGDMEIGSVDLQAYVNSAADEINGRLGFVYELPIELEAGSPGALILKKINCFIASGRVIMAQAVGGEQDGLQAYGASLVRLAYGDLALVLNRDLPLDGELIVTYDASRVPSITNRDATSSVEAFEDEFYGDGSWRLPRTVFDPPIWTPGP